MTTTRTLPAAFARFRRLRRSQALRDLARESGLPPPKDEAASEASADDGIVQSAVRKLKRAAPGLAVITDVCLCEYTSHGHCGVVVDGEVDNDQTLPLLPRTALSHA